MVRFFITLYHFLNRHKFLLYASLLVWVGLMTYCATQVKFEENITSIFPRKGENDYTARVFDNLKIKDKIKGKIQAKNKNQVKNKSQTESKNQMMNRNRKDNKIKNF